jgi:hypothetical protein
MTGTSIRDKREEPGVQVLHLSIATLQTDIDNDDTLWGPAFCRSAYVKNFSCSFSRLYTKPRFMGARTMRERSSIIANKCRWNANL